MLLCLAYTARGEEIEKDTAKIRNVELNEVVVQSFKQQRDLRLEPLVGIGRDGDGDPKPEHHGDQRVQFLYPEPLYAGLRDRN